MIKLIIKDDDAVPVAFAADNNDDDDVDANDNAGRVAPPPAAPTLVPGLAWSTRLGWSRGLRAVGGCTTMPNSLIDRQAEGCRSGRGGEAMNYGTA